MVDWTNQEHFLQRRRDDLLHVRRALKFDGVSTGDPPSFAPHPICLLTSRGQRSAQQRSFRTDLDNRASSKSAPLVGCLGIAHLRVPNPGGLGAHRRRLRDLRQMRRQDSTLH